MVPGYPSDFLRSENRRTGDSSCDHVRKEVKCDHRHEERQVHGPVPFPDRPAVHRLDGHQAVDRRDKVNGKTDSPGNCVESRPDG